MCYSCRIVCVCAAALSLMLFSGCGPTMTPEERQVLDFAKDAFGQIRGLIDPADTSAATTEFVGNHVEVSSSQWSYVLDASGQQTFRSKSTFPLMKSTFARGDIKDVDAWRSRAVPKATINEAMELAQSILGVDYAAQPAVTASSMRELLMSMQAGGEPGSVKYYEGRTAVLFTPPVTEDALVDAFDTSFSAATGAGPMVSVESSRRARRSHETSGSFTPDGMPTRVDSNYMTPAVREVVGVLREGLASGDIRAVLEAYDPSMKFGAFFDSEETRFEVSSYAWEGEDFLNPETIIECTADTYFEQCNPYYQDFFPVTWCFNDTNGDVAFYRTLDQYKFWMWYWWLMYGQQNGIRGNWNPTTQEWEYDVDVRVHRSLDSYELTTPLTQTVAITTCDDVTFDAPYGVDRKLEQAFYDDLERCHVVQIATHGGPIFSPRNDRYVYHMRRAFDHWVILHEEGDEGLGNGNLRHLFLETCASINWIYGPDYEGVPENIESDWMNSHVADGIRTVCGIDGQSVGYDRCGWRFFGSYHRGESISQSWINAALEECACNHPVILAYGGTEDEAASTLFDGRLTTQRAGTGWVIALEAWVDE